MTAFSTAYARRPAMGTFFEAFLAGDDREHLEAVAAAVLDEVSRLERLLSRFDPAAEVARVNREAGRRPVRVDADLWDILDQCKKYHRMTGGAFDVTAVSGAGGDALILDPERRTVRFARPDAFIDLGGFAKGCALDRAAGILRRFGVTRGLLNGGNSSILAVGRHPNGEAWRVAVRDPFGGEDAAPVAQLRLADQAFSCSGVLSPGQAESDVIAPRRGEPLTEQAACVVVAPTAAEAEALSTACLVMGKEQAREYFDRDAGSGLSVGWIDAPDGRPWLDWLKEAP
jgi:FAD:protein FMN transferase